MTARPRGSLRGDAATVGGSINGDGAVDKLDREDFDATIGAVAGDPNYLRYFDYDADGDIDQDDSKVFRRRFRGK